LGREDLKKCPDPFPVNPVVHPLVITDRLVLVVSITDLQCRLQAAQAQEWVLQPYLPPATPVVPPSPLHLPTLVLPPHLPATRAVTPQALALQ